MENIRLAQKCPGTNILMRMMKKVLITLALRRMVVEHNICTMVQLTAEDPDNFKYWSTTDLPDSEVDFGAMKVTLVRTTGATLKVIYKILFFRNS